MKSQVISVFLALLLIVVAIAPGISFGLNSSITSNFNSISILNDHSFGLYADDKCNYHWNGPAFGEGIVQVKDVNNHKSIDEVQDVALSGNNTVYLLVPKESEITSLWFSLEYHDDASALSSDCYIIITLKDTSTTGVVGNYIITLDGYSQSTPLLVSEDNVYTIDIGLHVVTSDDVTIGSTLPYLDITFATNVSSFINSNNTINFDYSFDDIEIKSGNHTVDEMSDCPIDVDGGIAYNIKQNGKDHFLSTGKTASVTINTKGGYGYYLYIDLGIPNGNKKTNDVTVTISKTNGEILVDSKLFQNWSSNSPGRCLIIGSDCQLQYSDSKNPPSLDNHNPYYEDGLIITVSGAVDDSGRNTVIDFFLIQVPISGAT